MASPIFPQYTLATKKNPAAILHASELAVITQPAHVSNHPPPPANGSIVFSTYARYTPPAKAKSRPSYIPPLPVGLRTGGKRKHEQVIEPNKDLPDEISEDREGKMLKTRPAEALSSGDAWIQRDGTGFKVEESRETYITPMGKRKNPDHARAPEHANDTSQTIEKLQDYHGKDWEKLKTGHDLIATTVLETRESTTKRAQLREGGIGDSKHKKMMEKRAKSMRKAEIAFKKSADEYSGSTPGGEAENPPVEVYDLVPLPQPEPISQLPPLSTSLSLPLWLTSPIRVSPNATAPFADLGVSAEAVRVLKKRGFTDAFAVQASVLPLLLPGKSQHAGDLLISAATGSGKTLAYVLPMIQDISRCKVTKLRGLVVLPTRELVAQAREVCDICVSAFPSTRYKVKVKTGTAVGNESLKVEQAMLMSQQLKYDNAEYNKAENRLNTKWDNSDLDSNGEYTFCGEESLSTLPGHVVRPISKIDILICTPGRLVEHIKFTPGFTLDDVKWLIIDEADKLVDQSFQGWLDVVMTTVQANNHKSKNIVRKVILSATMTRDIGKLFQLKLYRPKLIVLGSRSELEGDVIDEKYSHVLPALLQESGVKVEDEGIKPLYLMELLRRENIISELRDINSLAEGSSSVSDQSSMLSDSESVSSQSATQLTESLLDHNTKPEFTGTPGGVLIFTRSNETAIRLSRLISLLSPSASGSLGTLTSSTRRSLRKKAISAFSSGKISILVASDLVSRGLDLQDLGHVINYDLPTSVTSYVHRIGRTARAGKKGHAWSLYTPTEGRWFWNEIGREGIIQRWGHKVERVNIKKEIFSKDQRKRYKAALEELGREATE